MARLDDLDDGDISWAEVLSVIGLTVACTIGIGYIVLRLVGLL